MKKLFAIVLIMSLIFSLGCEKNVGYKTNEVNVSNEVEQITDVVNQIRDNVKNTLQVSVLLKEAIDSAGQTKFYDDLGETATQCKELQEQYLASMSSIQVPSDVAQYFDSAKAFIKNELVTTENIAIMFSSNEVNVQAQINVTESTNQSNSLFDELMAQQILLSEKYNIEFL